MNASSEGSEGASHQSNWGKNILSQGNSKGPEEGVCLGCLVNSNEVRGFRGE